MTTETGREAPEIAAGTYSLRAAKRARIIAWVTRLLDRMWFSRDDPTRPVRLHWTPELMDQFWNGIARTRLVELSFSRLGGKALIAAIAHLLPKDGRILDFGAGDGDLIELMCARGLHVAAYEPSEGRSQNLQKRLSGHPGFLGTVNAESTEPFDVVMLVEVIEHILEEQLDNTLKSLAAFTREGGILIVTTPNNEDLDLNMAYCPVSNSLFHRWQHVRSFTHESLVGLLAQYSFEELVTHQLEFKDDLYVPYDEIWGSPGTSPLLPHMLELRANRPTYAGSGMGLVYIGRRLGRDEIP